MPSSNGFVLSGGDAQFNDRQKQLFEQLHDAEKSFNKDKDVSQDSHVERLLSRGRQVSRSLSRQEVRKFRGQESIFKKPNNAMPRNRFRRQIQNVPDYHKNPSKWTKYTLEDSPDVTQKSNSEAAFAFLNELRNRNKGQDEEEETSMEITECVGESSSFKRNREIEKVVFKKRKPRTEGPGVIVEREEKPFFRSSKVIMPECVVGEKPKKIKEKKVKKVALDCDKKCIKLGHLDENEEDG